MSFPFHPELAYIGPGAGFAFLGSFVSILGGVLLGLISFLLWPIRVLWGAVTGRQGYKHAKVKKLIFLGLDGLDPGLAERYMKEGKLPNLSRLREQGSFHRLRTTFPALSPVAWSTFATGVNPARHAMFDFLNRSLSSYMPYLSSSRVSEPAKILKLGKYRIPLSRPIVEMRRKSKTFWQILGQRQIASTILRVPITFPPEKFNGRMLSAMCTPDLLGTQGTFALYTTRTGGAEMESGNRVAVAAGRGSFAVARSRARPTRSTKRPSRWNSPSPSRLERDGGAELEIDGERHRLALGEYTPWIKLTFSAGLGIKVSGIARFLLTENGDRSFALLHADQHRPRGARSADFPSLLLRRLPVETVGRLLHPRHGRGHVGAQRTRHRFRRIPEAGVPHFRRAQGDVLLGAGSNAPRRSGLRLRHHGPRPAHVLRPKGRRGRVLPRDRRSLLPGRRTGRPDHGSTWTPRRRCSCSPITALLRSNAESI